MKKAIQAKRRTPPAGFEARSDMQILKLTAETKPGRRMPRAAVILCVILAVMGLATTLAATVDVFNSRLHAFWPEAAEFLMPVNKSCESEGIRMEVISAVVKDNKVHVTFSMQDLEGDRLNEFTSVSFSEDTFPHSDEEEVRIWGSVTPLSFDAETKKGVYAQEFDYDPALVGKDYEIPLYIQYLDQTEYEAMDLHPLLEQYGNDAKAGKLPENARAITTDTEAENNTEAVMILDPAANLKIPLNECTELSGIGWIDGKLHVQIHYLEDKLIRLSDGGSYYPASSYAQMQGTDGITPTYWEWVKSNHVVFGWTWDDNGDEIRDWEEFIFPCDPADVQEGKLRAVTRFNKRTEDVEGNWLVKIPMKMIQFQDEGN